MASEYSEKIKEIMTRELGQLGVFVIKKQCKNLGVDPDNIKKEDILQLAKALGNVMKTFGGPEKGSQIEREIRRLMH